jgi:hypothetical protein
LHDAALSGADHEARNETDAVCNRVIRVALVLDVHLNHPARDWPATVGALSVTISLAHPEAR